MSKTKEGKGEKLEPLFDTSDLKHSDKYLNACLRQQKELLEDDFKKRQLGINSALKREIRKMSHHIKMVESSMEWIQLYLEQFEKYDKQK